jgi:hypothetical protein
MAVSDDSALRSLHFVAMRKDFDVSEAHVASIFIEKMIKAQEFAQFPLESIGWLPIYTRKLCYPSLLDRQDDGRLCLGNV